MSVQGLSELHIYNFFRPFSNGLWTVRVLVYKADGFKNFILNAFLVISFAGIRNKDDTLYYVFDLASCCLMVFV